MCRLPLCSVSPQWPIEQRCGQAAVPNNVQRLCRGAARRSLTGTEQRTCLYMAVEDDDPAGTQAVSAQAGRGAGDCVMHAVAAPQWRTAAGAAAQTPGSSADRPHEQVRSGTTARTYTRRSLEQCVNMI